MEYKFELQEAIEAGDIEKFRRLFDTCDLASDEYGGSLLHSAAEFGNLEIVEFLVDSGADVNRKGGRSKLTPLACAVDGENLDIVQYLVETVDSEIDLSRPAGNLLVRAARRGSLDIVEYFLSRGIDPQLAYRVPSGKLVNAYSRAQDSGCEQVVSLLDRYGCHEPVEGEDIPTWEPTQERMLNHVFGVGDPLAPNSKRRDQITQYMEERFGQVDREAMQERVQVIDGMSVAINVIQPNEHHPYLVLFTSGMSELPMNVPLGQEDWRFAELVIHLPPDWIHPKQAGTNPNWTWPIEVIRAMAYQPHLDESWLGLPAAIVSSDGPPTPLGPNTQQSCMFMIPDLSSLDPPLQTGDNRVVHFYTMVPLYSEEKDFEKQYGMERFFNVFFEREVPVTVNIERPIFCANQ